MTDRGSAHPPLIVITVADPGHTDDPALTTHKNGLYSAAIAGHGGTPALLHVATSPQERDRLLATMDGLLLSGGADIDPALYGEQPNGAAGIDPARDALDLAAWREAQRRALPVLGVCRGMQAINVFSGGSLIQDVPSHAGTPYGHGPARTHDLDMDPDSRLARAIAETAPNGFTGTEAEDTILELAVNTFHHQAVDQSRLAKTLRPVAWAHSEAGRLVEGLEGRDGRWVVGIQCHPERIESTPEELDGLWADFLQAVEAARAERAAATR